MTSIKLFVLSFISLNKFHKRVESLGMLLLWNSSTGTSIVDGQCIVVGLSDAVAWGLYKGGCLAALHDKMNRIFQNMRHNNKVIIFVQATVFH